MRVWQEMDQTDIINRAYELAYNFLLAIFPLLFFLFALLGIFVTQPSNDLATSRTGRSYHDLGSGSGGCPARSPDAPVTVTHRSPRPGAR